MTSPTGEKFSVVCRTGQSITNIRIEAKGHPNQQGHIRKVGELRSPEETMS